MFKHHINYCIDCNKNIDKRSQRCTSCSAKKRIEIFGSPLKNKKFSKEHRKKLSESRKINNFMIGKKLKDAHRLDCTCSFCIAMKGGLKGQKCHLYIDGRTPLTMSIRQLPEYFSWRNFVFERDNYTCQECFSHNGNGKTIILEAHHKKEFHKILSEFLQEYNQFSPIEDKETLVRLSLSWKDFWDINNGQTFCQDCHNLTKPGRKRKILGD